VHYWVCIYTDIKGSTFPPLKASLRSSEHLSSLWWFHAAEPRCRFGCSSSGQLSSLLHEAAHWVGRCVPSSPEACTAPHLHSSHLQVHRRDFGDDDCRDRQCSCGALQLNVLQTPCPACPMAQERRCSPELFPSSSWGAVGCPSPDTTLLTALCCLGSWAEPRSKEQLMDAVS